MCRTVFPLVWATSVFGVAQAGVLPAMGARSPVSPAGVLGAATAVAAVEASRAAVAARACQRRLCIEVSP
ncbi:hypothetical protein SAMN05421837_111293 [Amycolatopsis pretoriensis]|uniref:Secreted protein n=1 Tax=Amycolatopsis pretoriensis TaxID=218821 RepID=A0A1H5REP8_9PSEU|nr:hypothetical protein SAMN05421837_111293 [Amycolatopsis pretoriensis]